jgi:hypothetical protein
MCHNFLSHGYVLASVIIVRIIFLIGSLSEREKFLISSLIFNLDIKIQPSQKCNMNSTAPRYQNQALGLTANKSFNPRWQFYLCHFKLQEK